VAAAPWCHYFSICGGNTRVRAQQLTGDAWAEDPGCYLRDDEIGAKQAATRRMAHAFQQAAAPSNPPGERTCMTCLRRFAAGRRTWP
jgi:hypothetical protein